MFRVQRVEALRTIDGHNGDAVPTVRSRWPSLIPPRPSARLPSNQSAAKPRLSIFGLIIHIDRSSVKGYDYATPKEIGSNRRCRERRFRIGRHRNADPRQGRGSEGACVARQPAEGANPLRRRGGGRIPADRARARGAKRDWGAAQSAKRCAFSKTKVSLASARVATVVRSRADPSAPSSRPRSNISFAPSRCAWSRWSKRAKRSSLRQRGLRRVIARKPISTSSTTRSVN